MPNLDQLLRSLRIEFADLSLLRKALTHSSFLHENPEPGLEHNERLEFLGDAVLGYVVARELYLRFPSLTEGQMTELRAGMVRAESLTEIASRLHLGDYLSLGRGEELGGGRSRPSNLGRALEALIGAILLDQGMDAARSFVLKQLEGWLDRVGMEGPRKDYKSQLQEYTQSRWKSQPEYITIEESSSDEAKQFSAEALVEGEVMGEGVGPTKRTAQRHAAKEALQRLRDREAAKS